MEQDDVIQALSALAQPHRLQIFRVLVVAGSEGLTPGAIASQVGIPPATLSFHLKELTHARLVRAQQVGRNRVYRASFDQMNQVIGYLTENCCQGQECHASPTIISPCPC